MPTIAFDIASGNRDLSETARVCVFKETPRLGMARVLRGGGESGFCAHKKMRMRSCTRRGRCMHTEHGLKEREVRGSQKYSLSHVREA